MDVVGPRKSSLDVVRAHGLRGAGRGAAAGAGRGAAAGARRVSSEGGPRRAGAPQVADRCLEILANSPSVHTLDITGGAPELQPQFRRIVERARALRPDVDVIDRCNLTVLAEPDQEDLADFLAGHGVHVVASLPCYSDKNVNMQRGRGVFARSVEGLRRLNEVGYGAPDSPLKLDLVYNPLGAFLPPPQDALRAKHARPSGLARLCDGFREDAPGLRVWRTRTKRTAPAPAAKDDRRRSFRGSASSGTRTNY